MVKIKDLSIGDTIKGKKKNRKVTGLIVQIHPGAVVIINDKSEDREVVNIDEVVSKIN